jgi:predicted glutamine amidotransferase
MCQLTWMNLPIHILPLAMGLQMHINAIKNNPDGWGIYSQRSGVLKTSETANYTIGEKLASMDLSSPVLGHVRFRSLIYKQDPLNVKDNHPFEKTNIILAHNGTMQSEKHKSATMIDSEIFATVLDDYLTTHKCKIGVGLSEVMKDFTGKFAFLIYDKRTNEWVAARGITATLFIAYINLNGRSYYIINTDRDSLDNFLTVFFLACGSLGHKIFLEKDILILRAESIIGLGKNLTLLGDVKENYPKVTTTISPTTNTAWNSRAGNDADWWKNRHGKTETKFNSMEELNLAEGVSFRELDFAFTACSGFSMLECGEETFTETMNTLIKILRPHFTEQKIQLVKNLKQIGSPLLAGEFLPQVPIILNSPEELKDARKKMMDHIRAENMAKKNELKQTKEGIHGDDK